MNVKAISQMFEGKGSQQSGMPNARKERSPSNNKKISSHNNNPNNPTNKPKHHYVPSNKSANNNSNTDPNVNNEVGISNKRKAFQERRRLEKEKLKAEQELLVKQEQERENIRNAQFKNQPQVIQDSFTNNNDNDMASYENINIEDDGWDFGDDDNTKPSDPNVNMNNSNNSYQLTLPSILYYFKVNMQLLDEDLIFISEQIATILETGSAIGQQKRIDELFNSYKNLEYWPVERLGRGAFGQVFRGIIRSNRSVVAIKVIDLEEAKDDISIISREIQALCQSKGCHQLTTYYGSCIRGSELWIIMEYLPGGSIQDKIRIKPLSEKFIAIVAREVLLGLKFLLIEAKFHRDIKAGNLLLAENGQVKLADFGAAAQLTDTATKCSTFVGSPFWMAPEVMMNQPYNQLCDIWSLGITCIEMATGKPPHANLPAIRLVTIIPTAPPPALKGDFSPEFLHFVKACLVKNPGERLNLHALLKHPFITSAGSVSALRALL